MASFTENQRLVLRELTDEWQAPLRIGPIGRDTAPTLNRLCELGLCEWRWRSRGSGIAGVSPRDSKLYRVTDAGKLAQGRLATKEPSKDGGE